MSQITPKQAEALLDGVEAGLPDLLRDVLGHGAIRIGANAVARMRDAKGQGRRKKDDDGPLRIVTGTHAAATIVNGPNRRGAINRISLEGAKATLEKGYDTDVDKGAINEVWDERAKYKTLEPAADEQQAEIERYAQEAMERLVAGALA